MKAWELTNNRNDDAGDSLVFADTISKAKEKAFCEGFMYQHDLGPDSWIDIRAIRAPELDGWENKPETEIMYRLMTKRSWYFYDTDGKEWNSDNADDFYNKYLKEATK